MKYIEIKDFSGGIADSVYRGIPGSFGKGSYNLDIYSIPGILQGEWATAKDSGSNVTDLILWGIASSEGSTFFFGDSGDCYKRASNGTWTAPKDLTERVCGAAEYNGYIYAAVHDILYRVAAVTGTYNLANLSSWKTWTGAYVDANWHPMLIAPSGALLIGAGQYISMVDSSGNWNANALDLPPGWVIKCLGKMGDNVLIGASNSVKDESAIFVWDGFSDSFFTPTPCPESTINCILSDGRTVLVQAGYWGNIYQYTGDDFIKIRQIPGSYTVSALMEVKPGACEFYYGDYLFGATNTSGTPCDNFVYRLGRFNNNYPMALTKMAITSNWVLTGVDIGCIIQDGNNYFVSWKYASSYGVDKISYAAKATSVYDTQVLGGNSIVFEGTKFTAVIVNFEPLAASTSIELQYRKNGAADWTSLETYNTANGTNHRFCKGMPIIARTIEFRFVLTANSTSTPKINSILIEQE